MVMSSVARQRAVASSPKDNAAPPPLDDAWLVWKQLAVVDSYDYADIARRLTLA